VVLHWYIEYVIPKEGPGTARDDDHPFIVLTEVEMESLP
jgi:hypothetical protein